MSVVSVAEPAASAPSLGELVERARDGDESAWSAIVDRFAATVRAIARAHRLDDATASDVSQTTWLRLFEHLDRIDRPERVGAWLATTARRESLRVIRMAGRHVPTGDDFDLFETSSPEGPDQRILAEERAQLLLTLIERLPCRCRAMLHLLSTDTPLSYKELSEALELPVGSIGPTRAQCLEHLRRVAARAGLLAS